MSDSDLQITITADAGGVGRGTEQAKAAIAGLGSAFSGAQSTVSGFGAAVAKAFVAPNVGGVVQGVDQIKAAFGNARPSLDGFARVFDGMSNKLKDFGAASSALAGPSGAGQSGALAAAGKTGPDAGLAPTQSANNQIAASNAGVTTAYVAGQQQQQSVAQSVETAKTAASDRATAHILANDGKLLESLKSSVDSMISTFNRGLLQMAERSKSFAQVMRSLGQQLLNDMLRVVDQIVEKWAWGETEKLLASTQGQALLQALGLKDLAAQILIEAKKTQAVVSGATAQAAAKSSAAAAGAGPVNALQAIRADAAQVFGNVFAWMTSNPVTAPAAPAAAAAASAAVMAVPFALGTNFVPADTLAYVHQGERILPKADNTALMGALGALQGVTHVAPTTYRSPGQTLGASSGAGAGRSWSGPGGGAGATNHNTLVYSPQVTPQKDFRKDLQDHASDVFALLQRGIRDGVLKV